MVRTRTVWLAAVSLALAGCGGSSSGGGATTAAAVSSSGTTSPTGSSSTAATGTRVLASGTLAVLTYNVAGLPQGISGSSPVANTPQISPKLNRYPLVLVQEDFWHHAELARDAQHPFQSVPLTQFSTLVNDGLNRFSESPFVDHIRMKWSVCHGVTSSGADCLSSKGFSAARHELAPGVVVDVYDLHADAGSDQGDIDARIAQFAQLEQFMAIYSAGRPAIVAGDTNLKGSRRPRDDQTLADFMGATGLRDSARTLGAPEDIDRILFRSAGKVELEPLRWREADEFVDAAGNDLSDHEAVHVDFEWRLIR